MNHNCRRKTLWLGDRVREWLYLWTEAEGVAVKERRGCEYVCMTEGALLSRLAEQWKSICHREQTERQSTKVREKKRDRERTEEEKKGEKELTESSFYLLSHPRLSSPPLSVRPGAGGKKKRSAERKAERELSHACCSSAGLRNSRTFWSCAYTHANTHLNTYMLLFSWWYKSRQHSEREYKKERQRKLWALSSPFLWTIWPWRHLPRGKWLGGAEEWNETQGRSCWWRWDFH